MTQLLISAPANISTMATDWAKNNTNDDSECPQEKTEEWVLTVLTVYILLIAVLGIVFNVFVLMVFCLHKKACTVAEIYLSNLATADLVLMACLPFWAVYTANDYNWPFSHSLCRLVNQGIIMNAFCSIYFLVLVSMDRYVALVHPLSHSRMRRPKYAKLGCLLVWGLGLLLSVPTFVYRDMKYFPDSNATGCYLNYPNLTVNMLCEGMQIMFSFIIPIPIICFCTLKILRAVSSHLMEGLNCQKMERKATTLVLAVLLAFVICWVPFHFVRILVMLYYAKVLTGCGLQTVLDICRSIAVYIAFFNSVLNPILYVIVGKNFRTKVKELFMQGRSGAVKHYSMTSIHSKLTRSVK